MGCGLEGVRSERKEKVDGPVVLNERTGDHTHEPERKCRGDTGVREGNVD